MELNITQVELDSAMDNEINSLGNKIKLKDISLRNSIHHIKNIPYKAARGPKVTSSKFDLTSVQKELNVSPKKYIQLISGNSNPINVKDNMIENIKNHSLIGNLHNMDSKIEKSIELESEVSKTDANEQQSNEVDINKTFEEINSVRQQILSVKERADLAQKEAADSEMALQEIGMQYTETEKQLQEAEIRNAEIKQKIIAALGNQTATLNTAKKKYENIIADANQQKENNENKIVEFQSKIDGTREKLNAVNNDTARQQEILKALTELEGSDEVVQFPDMSTIDDEKVRKIA